MSKVDENFVSSQLSTFLKQKYQKTLNYIPIELGELNGPSIQEFIKDFNWKNLDLEKRILITKKFFQEVVFNLKSDKVIIFSKPLYTSTLTTFLGSSPEYYYSKCGFGKQQTYTDGKTFIPFYSAPSYKEADWTTGSIKFSYWTCVISNNSFIASQIIGQFNEKSFSLEIDDQWKVSKGLFSKGDSIPKTKKVETTQSNFDVEKEEIVTDRVLGNKIPTFYHKPKESKKQRRLIIKYFEDDERYAKIIPRSISFIYQLRQKDKEDIDKEVIESQYIIHLIKEDDLKHESLNPLIEVLHYDENDNSFKSIQDQVFRFTKDEETMLTFFVKRKFKYFAIGEYTKEFENYQSSLDFMKTLNPETTLNLRYYDLHHHGYTLIHMKSELPIYRTGTEKVKLLIQTHETHEKKEEEIIEKEVNIETSLMKKKKFENDVFIQSPNSDYKIPEYMIKKYSRKDTSYFEDFKMVFETYYKEDELKIKNVVPKIYPDFGGKVIEFLSPSGIESLKRILCVIGIKHPKVEFSPYLVQILALLLVYLPEEQTYTMFKELLDKKIHIKTTYLENYVMIKSCVQLIHQKLPGMVTYMNEKKFTIEYVITDLLNNFFVNHLSLPIVLKIFDEFFNNGCKEMIRVCYNFFCSLESEVYKMESPFEMHKLFTSKSLKEDDIFKFTLVVNIKDLEGQIRTQGVESPYIPFSRPKITDTSSIIESLEKNHHHYYETLFYHLPFRVKLNHLTRIFTTEKNGYSLSSLYKSIKDLSSILMLIEVYASDLHSKEDTQLFEESKKHSKKAVIGAFFGEAFSNNNCYEGTGDTIVFGIYPKKQFFKWSKKNDYFVYGKDDSLLIGGGGKGSAIYLDGLDNGSSHKCLTFENEPLCHDFVNFKVIKCEIFTFQ